MAGGFRAWHSVAPCRKYERSRTRPKLPASQPLRRLWDEFFLYEKMGRRAIILAESTSEAGTKIPPPITKKRWESKGTRPLGRRLAGSRPAALTLGQRPRGLPFPGKGRERGMLKMKGWLQ